MHIRSLVVALVALAPVAGAPAAFVVDDRSFFQGKPHTFLDFESRGDGTPLNLFFSSIVRLPPDEYAAQGVRFIGPPMVWADMGAPPGTGASSSDALAAVGSWPTVIGPTQRDVSFEIEFLVPVRSFGLGVVQLGFVHQLAPDPDYTTTITALNAAGEELGVVRLWDDLIDGQLGNAYSGGQFGDEWRWNIFGFLGLATEEPIARLRFDNAWESVFDDLHFSAIPAPGAGATLALLTLGALARRRRPSGG